MKRQDGEDFDERFIPGIAPVVKDVRRYQEEKASQQGPDPPEIAAEGIKNEDHGTEAEKCSRDPGRKITVAEDKIGKGQHMELERAVGDRVVGVSVPLIERVSRGDVIDLIMGHHPGTDQDKAAENSQKDDQRKDQLFP